MSINSLRLHCSSQREWQYPEAGEAEKRKSLILNEMLIGSDRIFGNQFSLGCISQGHSTRDIPDSILLFPFIYLFTFFVLFANAMLLSTASVTYHTCLRLY